MSTLLDKYGPLALVTGASSGIGEQFAHQLAAAGFDLIITARREQALNELSAELASVYRVSVDIVVCDLANAQQLRELIAYCESRTPSLIISNAGFGDKGDFLDHDPDKTAAMYRTNAIAPATLARALLPALVAKRRGGMIFTGSIEGEVAFPYSTPYAATKAFIHSLSRGLWHEMRAHNVDILLLAPGSTDTEAPLKQGMTRAQLIGLLPPETVVREALDALGRKMAVTPGLVNRSFIGFLKLLPRRWSTVVAGKGMLKAINDARAARSDRRTAHKQGQ